MTQHSAQPRLSFRLPLDPARLLRARRRIGDYLHERGVDEDAIGDVVLAVEEAMTNAVRHSGASDVEVRIDVRGADVHTEVTDHGIGFDAATVDVHELPDLLGTSGRGLYLMAHLMDELELDTNGGVSVHMRRHGARADRSESPIVSSGRHSQLRSGYQQARERSFLEEMPEGFAALDWEYHVVYMNQQALELYNLARHDLGVSVWQLFPHIPETALGAALRAAMELGSSTILEYPSPLVGRTLEYRVYPTSSGVSFYVRDIEERKRKERERDELLIAVRESEQRLTTILATIPDGITMLDVRSGRYALISPAQLVLTGFTAEEMEGFSAGQVLARVHPDDRATALAQQQRLAAGRDAPTTVEYRWRVKSGEYRWFSDRRAAILDAAGRTVALVGVSRDITERKRREANLALIADLGQEFASLTSGDDLLAAVGERLARHLDVTACYLADVDDPHDRFTITHAWTERRTPVTTEEHRFSDWVMDVLRDTLRARQTIVVDDALNDPRFRRRPMTSGLRALVVEPLHKAGRWTSAFVVASQRPHAWREDEVELIRDVASRTFPRIERARVEQALLTVAATLQESFIHPLPAVEGLELAALSLPAQQPELVGGDFHDVFPLPGGQVMILIGDVMGKGISAAGLTETVHSAARALALTLRSPERILRQVNRMLLTDASQQFVSVLLVLLDPPTGRARVVSAGHPPAVRFGAQPPRLLDLRYGPPLGTFDAPYAVTSLTLAPGEGLLLYTDGVTEARDASGRFFGYEQLLAAIASAPDTRPQRLVERLREVVPAFAGKLKDDLHVLVLRRTPRTPGPERPDDAAATG